MTLVVMGRTTTIFKLGLHFDPNYTSVKFHHCIKINEGQGARWGEAPNLPDHVVID